MFFDVTINHVTELWGFPHIGANCERVDSFVDLSPDFLDPLTRGCR